jgi:hypothetical protein
MGKIPVMKVVLVKIMTMIMMMMMTIMTVMMDNKYEANKVLNGEELPLVNFTVEKQMFKIVIIYRKFLNNKTYICQKFGFL